VELLNYIRKDDKPAHDPTEYIVLFEDIVDLNDFSDWEILSLQGHWWNLIKFVGLFKDVPGKFPVRIRKQL